MIPPLQLGPFDMQDAPINPSLSSIYARRTIDQNASEEQGRDHNLLRREVMILGGMCCSLSAENCHRHSAIHPRVSCELYLPASICKLPRSLSSDTESHKMFSELKKFPHMWSSLMLQNCTSTSVSHWLATIQWSQMSFHIVSFVTDSNNK